MNGGDRHFDYIIRVIQLLDRRFDIGFFITPKDFDTLWNWSEKRIPMRIMYQAFQAVIERWKVKNKPITSFNNFKYEVRKRFKAFMELNVGAESPDAMSDKTQPEESPGQDNRFEEVEQFLAQLPEPLQSMEERFQVIYADLKAERPLDLELLHRDLLVLFAENEELNVKTSIFLKNLDPKVRKPQLEERYRLNYLLNKFHVPDFELI